MKGNHYCIKVVDIPVLCVVTKYYPGTDFKINSISLEPNEDEEFEFELYDDEGNRQTWLETYVWINQLENDILYHGKDLE